mmetsp:Transcript_5661/g.14714  ORF Transcript_5661/g.14714 Transcript_5661/m.14714 type:complete len:217 (+) Transcript_5661:1044-1694(+)
MLSSSSCRRTSSLCSFICSLNSLSTMYCSSSRSRLALLGWNQCGVRKCGYVSVPTLLRSSTSTHVMLGMLWIKYWRYVSRKRPQSVWLVCCGTFPLSCRMIRKLGGGAPGCSCCHLPGTLSGFSSALVFHSSCRYGRSALTMVLVLWPPFIESRWRMNAGGCRPEMCPGWHTMTRLQCSASWMGMNRNFLAKMSVVLVQRFMRACLALFFSRPSAS